MILFDLIDNRFLGGVAVNLNDFGDGEIVAAKVDSPLRAWELDGRADAVRFIKRMQTVTHYRGDGLVDELGDVCRWQALELVPPEEPGTAGLPEA